MNKEIENFINKWCENETWQSMMMEELNKLLQAERERCAFNKSELLVLRQFIKDDLRKAQMGEEYTEKRLTNLYSLEEKIRSAIRED